jgi:hypothetical protein
VSHAYVVGLATALATLVFVIEMLRRGILREKYAALWLLVATALLVVAIFPQLLAWAASSAGVAVPANLLFFVSGIVLLLVSVQLSYEVSRLEARTRRLAEEVALLRNAVDGWPPHAPTDGRERGG